MASPAYFNKLVNYTAALRKSSLKAFGSFSPNDNLDFIADPITPTATTTQIVSADPVESPNGVRTTFTFSAPPKYLIYNGQQLQPSADFTVSGNVATMAVAPATGARLFAYI